MFGATFNLVTSVGVPLFLNTVRYSSLEINSIALNNCFNYINVLQNGVNAFSKVILKNPVFVKKLIISCSLDHTILFKFH